MTTHLARLFYGSRNWMCYSSINLWSSFESIIITTTIFVFTFGNRLIASSMDLREKLLRKSPLMSCTLRNFAYSLITLFNSINLCNSFHNFISLSLFFPDTLFFFLQFYFLSCALRTIQPSKSRFFTRENPMKIQTWEILWYL